MIQLLSISLVLAAFLCGHSPAVTVKIPGESCRFSNLVGSPSEKLLTSSQRRRILEREGLAGIRLAAPTDDGSFPTEREVVRIALKFFQEKQSHLPVAAKQALWEELMTQVDQMRDHDNYHVSYGFRIQRGAKEYLVYQGPLEFPEGHNTLVLHPNGEVTFGFAPRIEKPGQWDFDFSSLPPL